MNHNKKMIENIVRISLPCDINYIQIAVESISQILNGKNFSVLRITNFINNVSDHLLNLILSKTAAKSKSSINVDLIEKADLIEVVLKENSAVKFILTLNRNEELLAEAEINIPKNETDVCKNNGFSYTVRRMIPEECFQISKCAYEVYGSTYIYSELYYPDIVKKLNQEDKLLSYVAVSPENDIMGHVAFKTDGENGEMLAAFTRFKYRGMKCLESISVHLMKDAEERKLTGIFANAVTTHKYSQKSAKRLKMVECALMLSSVKPLDFKEISPFSRKRESVFLYYKYLKKPKNLNIYVPEKHRAIVSQIYRALGVPVNFLDAKRCAMYSKTDITVRLTQNNTYLIYINKYGKGIIKDIITRMKTVSAANLNVVFLYLSLADPLTEKVTHRLENLGFLFCGVMPGAENNYLILQYLNSYTGYEEIKTASAFSKKLFDYVRNQDARVRDYSQGGKQNEIFKHK